MSHKPQSPALHIARKHQSSPKETDLGRAVKKAAEEIDGGRWIDDDTGSPERALDGMGLTLPTGELDSVRRRMGMHGQFAQEVDTTRTLNKLGRHPRVQEAIEKLQGESDDGKRPDEVLEREWKLWEMTRDQVADNKWDGQGRWEGAENEEMRHGQLLAPFQFRDQLCKTIGKERLIFGTTPSRQNPEDLSWRVGIYVPNPQWKGEAPVKYKNVEMRKLRAVGEEKLKHARRLRAAGFNAEADKAFAFAAEVGETAGAMMMEINAEESVPQLLRVASLQGPLSTEWMCMHFDEFGVPTEAKYLGWRTALLTMVRTRAITEAEAHTAFPVDSLSKPGEWYLQQLYRLRNPGTMVN
jgi:hypothetical protein